MKNLNKFLLLVLTTANFLPTVADSGKGKILTAVYNTQNKKVVEFKARPNITNDQFYSLVAKKTGIDRDKLRISGVNDSKHIHLSAERLSRFKNHPPRATQLRHRARLVGRTTRVVTTPIEPLADVTVVPVADATDTLLLGL